MTQRQIIRYWAAAAGTFLLFLYVFSGILAPFLFGAGLAYLTDPLATKLERRGLSRTAATLCITASVFVVLLIAIALIAPVLADQAQRFAVAAPGYIENLAARAHDAFPAVFPDFSSGAFQGELAKAADRSGTTALAEPASRWGVTVLKGLLTGGSAVAGFLGIAVITPIVAFYLLLDWKRVVGTIDGLLPRRSLGTVRRLAGEIDQTLAAFLRGQLLVCLILGTFYAVALTFAGLPFGVLVGAFAGIISFVPFVGSIAGLLLSMVLAMAHFWGEFGQIAVIAGIFLFGQAIEGNVLSPLLIGERVGLHPVWLIFSLSAFGYVFGFPGLLVAVPLAASLGVIARWGVKQYQDSQLYTGRAD